jgi:DNA modification methylase
VIRLLQGDCRDVLATLPADSVHCVVCSPPYWGLRDYQTGTWEGGDAACDHKAPSNPQTAYLTGRCSGEPWGEPDKTLAGGLKQFRSLCGKCGARRVDAQIGLEATPEEWLATLVGVFREVRRVLHPTGCVFLNCGDAYRDKQLQMLPARLALALQADQWILRSDIIWAKPNPMPESVQGSQCPKCEATGGYIVRLSAGRPTSAHEHVFLLTRSARYFYDANAVREDETSRPQNWTTRVFGKSGGDHRNERPERFRPMAKGECGIAGRNLRNVWTIATEAFPAAHYATFPTRLVETCIKAGTSARGCCSTCGAPWVRVTETTYTPGGPNHTGNAQSLRYIKDGERVTSSYKTRHDVTTGWAPSCTHNAECVPATVLDPFVGSGTTCLVASRLQRDAIGIDLNTSYAEMAVERCRNDAPLLTEFDLPAAEPPEDERMADLFSWAAD